MVTATLPARRSLLGKAASVIGRSALAKRRVQAVAAAAREHVITVAALGCVDYAAFTHSHFAGWLTAGICALVLDFKVQG